MAKKVGAKVIRKTKLEKMIEKEEKERTFLEKLGFVQMVFDFYAAPVA
jgi:hypothetical protein